MYLIDSDQSIIGMMRKISTREIKRGQIRRGVVAAADNRPGKSRCWVGGS